MNFNTPYLSELCNKLTNNIDHTIKLLSDYNSNDWENLVKDIKVSDCNCNKYYKLLVFNNDIVDVFLIIWFDGAETSIHDHPDGGCAVKILKGDLVEEVFENVSNNRAELICNNLTSKLLEQYDITCKVGNKILHRIKSNDYAVSIHVYFPPNYKQTTYLIK